MPVAPGEGRLPAPVGMSHVAFFELTRAGGEAPLNGDAVGHWPIDDGLVFAMAAGLGEGDAGAEASALALELLAAELSAAPAEWPVLKRLRRAVQTTNVGLYHKRVTIPELRTMGTTLTVTALVDGALTTAHVGDCRLWLLRRDTLTQLTKDNTRGSEGMRGGVLSPGNARIGPRRYSLPRCLGYELTVSIDLLTMDLYPGDLLAHTSASVHAALSEREMLEIVEVSPPEAACHTLVQRARAAEGQDDTSVQVAVVGRLAAPAPRAWWRLGL